MSGLNEDFTSPTGELIGFIASDIENANPTFALEPQKHYNIRSFHSDNLTVPRTVWDMRYKNATAYNGTSMFNLGSTRRLQGEASRPRAQEELNEFTQEELNSMTQEELNALFLGAGNEEWNIDDPGIRLVRDPLARYAPTLEVDVPVGDEIIAHSSYDDDILTGFEGDYNIILQFPRYNHNGGPSLDLDNSFLEFTSSDNYAPAETDSIPFSEFSSVALGLGYRDDFSTDTISAGDWTFDSGSAAQLSITGGQLIVVTPAETHLFLNKGPFHTNTEVTTKITLGTIGATIESTGLWLKRVDSGTRLLIRINHGDVANDTIDIVKQIDGGALTNLATVSLGTNLTTGTTIWLNGRIDGNNVTCRIYMADPDTGAAPSHTLTHTLTGDDATRLGGTAVGRAGIYFSSWDSASAAALDDFRIIPFVNDAYVIFSRDILQNVDLTDIRGIRFRLYGQYGPHTFRARAMRLVPPDYDFNTTNIAIDTKRGKLTREFLINSINNSSLTSQELSLMWDGLRPYDNIEFIKFNTGTLSSSGFYSAIDIRSRIRLTEDNIVSDYLSARLAFKNDQTILEVSEAKDLSPENLLGSESFGPLRQHTDYAVMIQTKDNIVTAAVYELRGAFLGDVVATIRTEIEEVLDRGYVGFRFVPQNYDQTVDWVRNQDETYAKAEWGTFISLTPVIGATLAAHNSNPENIIADINLVADGDAIVTNDSFHNSLKITRNADGWIGGVKTNQFFSINNTARTFIEGRVFPVNQIRGDYRFAIKDPDDSVIVLAYLDGLVADQWNDFSISLNTSNLVPVSGRLHFHQTGFYNDIYYLDELVVNYLSVLWEASADDGESWYPFLTAVNNIYTGVHFPRPGDGLKVRATALSPNAWIDGGYDLVPHYGTIGHQV